MDYCESSMCCDIATGSLTNPTSPVMLREITEGNNSAICIIITPPHLPLLHPPFFNHHQRNFRTNLGFLTTVPRLRVASHCAHHTIHLSALRPLRPTLRDQNRNRLAFKSSHHLWNRNNKASAHSFALCILGLDLFRGYDGTGT